MKPIPRSKMRLALGTCYYQGKRYASWVFGRQKFATTIRSDTALCPSLVAKHQTPLLRQLKDVDMWLQHNKVKNLQLAIKRLDGLILFPGETFSYWKRIGKPTRRKGYVEGMVLFYGGFKPGVGGGLCQLSNLIYWITLHTPLQVTERHRHSYDVFPDANRSQPFGSGATCAYNYLDLQIYNPLAHPYQLHVHIEDGMLIGSWTAAQAPGHTYEICEREHRMTQEHWGGYMRHNMLYRKVFNLAGEQIDEEYITENHALMMYQPFLQEGD